VGHRLADGTAHGRQVDVTKGLPCHRPGEIFHSEAVGHNQTAPGLERVTKRRRCVDPFCFVIEIAALGISFAQKEPAALAFWVVAVLASRGEGYCAAEAQGNASIVMARFGFS
jgi:hypothetical protein